MNIAVLSDIHSNKYALSATLQFLEDKNIDRFIFLGDFFGYYPWAAETFNMIEKLFPKSIHILGNHDELIKIKEPPIPTPEYWNVIIQNKNNLSAEAIKWLSGLKPEKKLTLDNINFKLYHGTPANPLMGRFYPDNKEEYEWFPKENEVLLMGHTHYPLLIKTRENGLIINPGSVGQPRDGILNSSLCIITTEDLKVNFFRVPYLIDEAISELKKINWYPRAINSLKKTAPSRFNKD